MADGKSPQRTEEQWLNGKEKWKSDIQCRAKVMLYKLTRLGTSEMTPSAHVLLSGSSFVWLQNASWGKSWLRPRNGFTLYAPNAISAVKETSIFHHQHHFLQFYAAVASIVGSDIKCLNS